VEHVKWDLGSLKRGSVVEVQLRNQANVLLLDSSNYRNYARGNRARYYGGLAKPGSTVSLFLADGLADRVSKGSGRSGLDVPD
jgi:hypothetical protein